MSRRPRRNHTSAFKAKVALAAIKGERWLSCRSISTSTPIRVRIRARPRPLRLSAGARVHAAAAFGCWLAFQFHGSKSATLLAG